MSKELPALGNCVLDGLPHGSQRMIRPLLKRVALARGIVTTREGEPLRHVDFPIDAVISVMAGTRSGKTIEVASVGREGYVETDGPLQATIAQRSTICRLPGAVMRILVKDFRAFLKSDVDFVELIRRATSGRFFVTEQAVLCNAHHKIDQRLARWLLLMRDRSSRERFRITHAELAAALGVRRAGISLAIARLRLSGAIESGRGNMILGDRAGLLEESCECYDPMHRAIFGPAASSAAAPKMGLRP